MLCGIGPWRGSETEIRSLIKSGSPNYSSPKFSRLSLQAQSFIRALLAVDPSKRMSSLEALRHPFLQPRRMALLPWQYAEHMSQLIAGAALVRSLRGFVRSSSWRRLSLAIAAWSLPPEDCYRLRLQFNALDTDNDGVISAGEFRRVLALTG